MFNYKTAPNAMGDTWRYYVERGIPPGSFALALLENNLMKACGRADDVNIFLIPDHVRWLMNEIPGGMWGSPNRVRQHIDTMRSSAR